MSQDSKWSVHDNIWHFSVSDPQLHRKGYTVYKVTCKTFPIKSPETLTEVVCWKRYNDFKTLHKALLALHKALHRRDQFPEFAKPKLFGRFDETVIEERRLSAVELLNFVATQPHLYKSLVFKQFLEDGKTKSDSKRSSVMTPRPSDLDILSGGTKPDGNPPPDLLPPSKSNVDVHRELVQNEANMPNEMNEQTSRNKPAGFGISSGTRPESGDFSGVPVLEGTWNFPQVADNISLDSSTGDETVDTDDESVLATSLPDTDLAFFDPVGHDVTLASGDEQEGSLTASNSWLLAGLNMCAEMETEDQDNNDEGDDIESDSATTPKGPEPRIDGKDIEPQGSSTSSATAGRMTPDMGNVISGTRTDSFGSLTGKGLDFEEFDPIRKMSQTSESSKVECGKGDLDLSAEWGSRSASFASHTSTGSQRSQSVGMKQSQEKFPSVAIDRPASKPSSRSQSVGSDKSQGSDKTPSNKTTPVRSSKNLLKRLVTGSPGRNKPRSATEQSVSTMDLGGKEDYIYLAASQICMAQNSEANGDFEVAFAYYKSGVGILLQGVQGDTNKSRRDAVRRKTAQYLMKAEDLFNRHLASENVDERRWGADSFLSPSLDLDPSFAFIRGSVRELRNFQVLGIIEKVVLVRDKLTDETFVIKNLPKSTPDTNRTQSILPTSCPYMVSLHKFYETDDSIFLLLQYASGGKLWTYIEDYLNTNKGHKANAGYEYDVTNTLIENRNIYSGTKVENKSDVAVIDVSRTTTGVTAADAGERKSDEDEMGKTKEADGFSNGLVQCSEGAGVMRFSTLKKDFSELSAIDKLVTGASENKQQEIENSDVSCDLEGEDQFNDSQIKDVLSLSFKKQPLNRRFSSLSDDWAPINEGDSSVISPTTLPEDDPFQSVLQENRLTLEGFSINSFDSEETSRLSLSFREKIDSIAESNDEDSANSSRHFTSRQISADEVFSQTRSETLHPAGYRARHASVDGMVSEHSDKRLISTFNSHDIIESSKELLKQVDRVLSESDDRITENKNAKTVNASGESFVEKRNSAFSDNSAEEPSIYDLHRPPEDDTSDSISNSNSDKNMHSPTAENVEFCSPHSDDGVVDQDKASTSLGDHDNLYASNTFNTTVEKHTFNEQGFITKSGFNSLGALGSNPEKDGTKHHPRTSSCSSVFRPPSTSHKLSLSRMQSKDMTRSASFECDLKSPTRNRARMVSDLFERLDSTGTEQVRIPEPSIKKWIAQMVTAVSRLHSLGIICRDLKPSNILLGDGGQICLTYFCHLGHGDSELDWDAVEDLYAAPEVGSIGGYGKSCDWWSVGALLYEMTVGRSLTECHPGGINSHTCLHVPAFVSDEARGLLEGLLRHNPNERLGSGIAGSEEIKAHPFFTGVDWHVLEYS